MSSIQEIVSTEDEHCTVAFGDQDCYTPTLAFPFSPNPPLTLCYSWNPQLDKDIPSLRLSSCEQEMWPCCINFPTHPSCSSMALPLFPWMQMFSRTRHWTLLGQKHCNNEIITTDGIPLWDNPWLTSFHSCWLTQLRQSNDLRTTTKNEQEQHNNKHEQKLLLPQLFLLLNTSYFVPGDD